MSLELRPGSMAAMHLNTFSMPGSELKLSLSLVNDALSLATGGEQGLFLLKVPLNDPPRLHGAMTGLMNILP
ncbi:hypothetical protein MKQ70_16670 [Chitinophaga sedimenti]|uniref:hypothetical protein n=1 Tax=Chitinophaga sedimenti TaxID=2033606 RepID=UPI0020044773|nr:hypothetical protein [Chitinophaga sedimenti]MCK7556562.1 hypothetical protein [Chitinophaga sedimenti]